MTLTPSLHNSQLHGEFNSYITPELTIILRNTKLQCWMLGWLWTLNWVQSWRKLL